LAYPENCVWQSFIMRLSLLPENEASQMDDQRVLIALRELRASDAVTPYFLGEGSLVSVSKAQLLEEKGLIGEHADSV